MSQNSWVRFFWGGEQIMQVSWTQYLFTLQHVRTDRQADRPVFAVGSEKNSRDPFQLQRTNSSTTDTRSGKKDTFLV